MTTISPQESRLAKAPQYSLRQVSGLTEEQFLRCLKTRYADSLAEAKRYLRSLEGKYIFNRLIEVWDQLIPYMIDDQNEFASIKMRRLFFWSLRPERFFSAIETKVLDTLTRLSFTFIRDANDKLMPMAIELKYELHLVQAADLGLPEGSPAQKTLRCWCPSTNNEHWIFIAPITGSTCVEAIDFIFGLRGYSEASQIFRQGDILFFVQPNPESNARRKLTTNLIVGEA